MRPVHRRRSGEAPAPAPDGGASDGPIDLQLLEGFRFGCLPHCGLCCFATPQVQPAERARLLSIEPELVLEEDPGPWTGIALQGPGGACGLLADTRCRAHADRPSPCRLFPIHVHAGVGVQATLVLSCPGVDLAELAGPPGIRTPARSGYGLDEELHWLDRLSETPGFLEFRNEASEEHARIQARSRGKSHPSEEVQRRERWALRPPLPTLRDFPAAPGPYEGDGLEALPLFHHPTHGIVALSGAGEQVDLLALDPRGGVRERLGTYPNPERLPTLDADASAMLTGYLRLLVRREAFADAVRHGWIEERGEVDFFEMYEEELRGFGATVISRAVLRAMLDGRPGGVLDARDVAAGIRATDAEVLDLPVVGRNL
jgi:Putative zinc- or iron-chelating domain